ncbi:MAG: hypothetical protein KAR47_04000, partial [Planctomycetes bacterium]|nr:hypothetical protein [Planctomycetota bacterium]
YTLVKTANQLEIRMEILENGKPLIKREVKKLADLPKGVQDAVNKETATTPGATATVQLVTKFDYWQGKPEERFFTADVRGEGLAVDLKISEYGTVLDREER